MNATPRRLIHSPGTESSGFSFLPVLGGVALLAAFAGLTWLIVRDSPQARAESELAAEVCALNAALAVHRIFHGPLEPATAPENVLAQLQRLDLATAFIDRRLRAEIQDSEDAASDAARAVWNRLTDRFEIAYGWVPGVKRFYIDADCDVSHLVEAHRLSKLDFETNGNWIWDYEEKVEPVVKSISPHGAKVSSPAQR